MNEKLILEEINRIGYLMNYNIENSSDEQVSLTINEERVFNNIVSEAPVQGQQKQGQQQKLTPEQIATAKTKIQQQADKQAYAIFGELMKAFDMDGDKDLKDNDGTNEGGAVAAIQKIKNKETLDSLNRYIGKWKQYPNLKTWLNAEMSDFDGEYGQIWAKLEKMGYAGANYNVLLKVAGYTPIGMAVKGADKAIDSLRSLSLEQIMEGFREIMGGVAGTVGTLILSVTGPIGAGINMLLYGVLTAWDVTQKTQGSDKFSWFNLILDTLSLVLSAIGLQSSLKSFAGAKAAFTGVKTPDGFFKVLAQKFPELSKTLGSVVGKITGAAGKVVAWITKGVTWLIQKLPFLSKFGNYLKGALGSIGGVLDEIGNAIKGVAGKVVAKTGGQLTQKASQLLAKGTGYLVTWGKVSGKKLTEFLGSKIATDVLKEVDKKILDYIKDFIWKNGEKNVETLRPSICKLGKPYCNTFDIVLNGVMIAHTGKQVLEPGKKTVKSTKELAGLKDVKGFTKKTEKIAKATQAGTKLAKTGYKSGKEIYGTATNTAANLGKV